MRAEIPCSPGGNGLLKRGAGLCPPGIQLRVPRVQPFDVILVGNDLFAACFARAAQKGDMRVLWLKPAAAPVDRFEDYRIVSPVIGPLVFRRDRGFRRVLQNFRFGDIEWGQLAKSSRALPFALHRLARKTEAPDDEAELILGALVNRSLEEYTGKDKARLPRGMIEKTGLTFLPEPRTPETAERVRKIAGTLGLGITEGTDAPTSAAIDGAFSIAEGWVVPGVSDIVEHFAGEFVARGGVVEAGPVGSLTRDAENWVVQRGDRALQARNLVVTSVEVLQASLPQALRTIPIGRVQIARQHFGPHSTKAPAVLDASGHFSGLLTSRGLMVSLHPQIFPAAAVAKRALNRVAKARLAHLAGEPRDEMALSSVWHLPDSLPLIDAAPGVDNLWIGVGLDQLDAAIGPAAASLLLAQMRGLPNPTFGRIFGAARFKPRHPLERAFKPKAGT